MTSQNTDAVNLLNGLLQAYSPTLNEAGAVNYLVDQMRGLGYRSVADTVGNAVGWRGEGPNEIVLLGHIDTVPGEIPVHFEGDHLFGRGAVDAKGCLACFTCAAARVELPPGWRLTVIGAVGEEGNSRGARYLVDKHTPRFAIIGEPSSWDRVTLGYKGSQWFSYQMTRPLSHTASRNESPCETAVNFWNRLAAKADQANAPYSKVFDQITPSLRRFESSGDGFNETARLQVNLRLPLWMNVDTARGLVQDLAGETAELAFNPGDEAYRADKNNPLLRAFLAAIRKAGGDPRFSLKSGTSDMNTVGPVWSCPIVAYGPGASDLDHTPGENILVTEYERSIKILTGVLQALLAGD